MSKEKTEAIFATLERNLQTKGTDLVEKVNGVIVFDVGGKEWTLDLSSGAGSLGKGAAEEPDLVLTTNDANFEKLVSGKLNPQQAFLFRKLKIQGSMAKAMKVTTVLDAARATPSKL